MRKINSLCFKGSQPPGKKKRREKETVGGEMEKREENK